MKGRRGKKHRKKKEDRGKEGEKHTMIKKKKN